MIIHIAGNSTERLSGDIGRRYERFPKTWRTFCSSINDLPKSAMLQRALSRDTKIRLGSLVAPSGKSTQSEGVTLDLLLNAYFPTSTVMEGGAVSAASCQTFGLARGYEDCYPSESGVDD
jgi:hypothetical protein